MAACESEADFEAGDIALAYQLGGSASFLPSCSFHWPPVNGWCLVDALLLSLCHSTSPHRQRDTLLLLVELEPGSSQHTFLPSHRHTKPCSTAKISAALTFNAKPKQGEEGGRECRFWHTSRTTGMWCSDLCLRFCLCPCLSTFKYFTNNLPGTASAYSLWEGYKVVIRAILISHGTLIKKGKDNKKLLSLWLKFKI